MFEEAMLRGTKEGLVLDPGSWGKWEGPAPCKNKRERHRDVECKLIVESNGLMNITITSGVDSESENNEHNQATLLS